MDKKGTEFLCKLKFHNTLPEVPTDPKFLKYPHDNNRFVKYVTTSLENSHKSIFHTEVDLGVPLDIIDSTLFKVSTETTIDEQDMQLITSNTTKTEKKNVNPSSKLNLAVPWLRKTEYFTGMGISDEKKENKEK